jgi:membrane protein implicated in regulation of membrane protease activity
MGFADLWLWLIFVIIGLVLVLVELLGGAYTGFDLVFVGSALMVGGLAGRLSQSWEVAVIVTCACSVAYIAIGRRYVHRRLAVKKELTNIDAILGKQGVVIKNIAKHNDGLVKIDNERWRARAEESIKKGEQIVVTDVSGVTLIVTKDEGGDS